MVTKYAEICEHASHVIVDYRHVVVLMAYRQSIIAGLLHFALVIRLNNGIIYLVVIFCKYLMLLILMIIKC